MTYETKYGTHVKKNMVIQYFTEKGNHISLSTAAASLPLNAG